MRILLCALGAVLAAALPAKADDSSAMLSAGGIVFTKSTPVRMAAEDLYVSPKAVRIRFEFANDTAKDVETVVAFPLPDLDTAEFWGSAVGTLTDDARNFVGFTAKVDGKPVAFRIDQRAILKGKDVTDELLTAGVPVNVVAGEGYRQLDALSPDKKKKLIAQGLADGGADEFVPQWTVKTAFYWTQKFPAHKTVVIEHSYQPVTGQSFFSPGDMKRSDKYDNVDYCFDEPTWATLRTKSAAAKKAQGDAGGYLNAYQTGYILMTARNWSGPIGRFHLTLDKLKPDNVLSLCWDGALKRSGPTTFEFTQTNFTPARDIHLLVLETQKAQ
ncbi:MAG: DUF4424 family protein [Alphaproteobacteria bacterium]|nr:DUF4424 family protein [Alphaproteobacteria bacterium]